jgi:hypothetical protein
LAEKGVNRQSVPPVARQRGGQPPAYGSVKSITCASNIVLDLTTADRRYRPEIMDTPAVHPDVFVHIRIIVGMVLGLSLTRLVTGLTRFVQHPKREQIYPIHFGWVLFMLLSIVYFWWFEFGCSLSRSGHSSFTSSSSPMPFCSPR